jgi:hypothetical protein
LAGDWDKPIPSYEHGTQLWKYIADLQEAQRIKKTAVPIRVIDPLLISITEFITKTREQPTNREKIATVKSLVKIVEE